MTQARLIGALKQQFPGRVKDYRFGTGLTNKRAVSETQRTRTFLYGSIAFALATALGQRAVTFYENGITSLNFPRRQDLLNARASRTTHPRTMFLLSEFLSHVAGTQIALSNVYRWKTKTDVLEVLKTNEAVDLIPSTVTCSRTTMTRGDHTHCGGCLQCIDRRFSANAAGLSDVDHSGLYTLDIFRKTSLTARLRRRFSITDGSAFDSTPTRWTASRSMASRNIGCDVSGRQRRAFRQRHVPIGRQIWKTDCGCSRGICP